MPPGTNVTDWLGSALELERWMRRQDFEGHDPHDLLSSPVVRTLCLGNRWLAVAWTQLGKRSPVQLRGLLRVPKARNPKAIGLVLSAWSRLHGVAGSEGTLNRREDARAFVAWLDATASRGRGAGWGYPFPWANRAFHAPAGTPSSVVTAFVGHGLLDVADTLGLPAAAELAAEAGEFLLRSLNRVGGPKGTFAFSYTPLDRRVVHNASLLAASLLARLSGCGLAGDEAAAASLQAARFSVAQQRSDGSWPYGTSARDGWVDSFHTGYTLVALDEIGRSLRRCDFDVPIQGGLSYWRRAFLVGPAIGCSPGAAFPVETHALAQGIMTLSRFRGWDREAIGAARRLGAWALREMRDPDGYFHYRRTRYVTNRLPYMRWVQAWMLLALAELASWDGADPPARPVG